MSRSEGTEIVQQLFDNAAEIITSADAGSERLIALAIRQKHLIRTLAGDASHFGPGAPQASIKELQALVAKAVDAIQIQMSQNRGSMQAAGIKKRVLRAYGTVTVSPPPA